jgi:hypothetical protein
LPGGFVELLVFIRRNPGSGLPDLTAIAHALDLFLGKVGRLPVEQYTLLELEEME